MKNENQKTSSDKLVKDIASINKILASDDRLREIALKIKQNIYYLSFSKIRIAGMIYNMKESKQFSDDEICSMLVQSEIALNLISFNDLKLRIYELGIAKLGQKLLRDFIESDLRETVSKRADLLEKLGLVENDIIAPVSLGVDFRNEIYFDLCHQKNINPNKFL